MANQANMANQAMIDPHICGQNQVHFKVCPWQLPWTKQARNTHTMQRLEKKLAMYFLHSLTEPPRIETCIHPSMISSFCQSKFSVHSHAPYAAPATFESSLLFFACCKASESKALP